MSGGCVPSLINLTKSVPNTRGRVPFNNQNAPHALQLTEDERRRHDVGCLEAITKFTDDGLEFESDSFIQPVFWAKGRVPQAENIAYQIEGRSGAGKSRLFARRLCGDRLRLDDHEHPEFWAEVRISPVNKTSATDTKRDRQQRDY
jgi:hypothetical protein